MSCHSSWRRPDHVGTAKYRLRKHPSVEVATRVQHSQDTLRGFWRRYWRLPVAFQKALQVLKGRLKHMRRYAAKLPVMQSEDAFQHRAIVILKRPAIIASGSRGATLKGRLRYAWPPAQGGAQATSRGLLRSATAAACPWSAASCQFCVPLDGVWMNGS